MPTIQDTQKISTETEEQYLWKIKSYITIFPKKSDKANEEAKVYYYLATFLFERKEYQEVLSYLEKSIALLSKMEGFTIQGDLFFYRARTLEIVSFVILLQHTMYMNFKKRKKSVVGFKSM